ncbi:MULTISPECIES: hypothetical protein [Clostridium]|uniref:Uncharacterized protein n=1 Tax=Clostridium sporogenes TaxID=1509 RepID=A0AAE6IB74_CLOSG|nr:MULTISPECIES: hypothetical protein [Clostridium]APQ78768.1 hypothetical protein RSJ10_3665 [Clostridium botulinum]MBN3356027.1 hypothetical protein [Clostridium botulinum]QDY34631.1 hypothetical protein CGS26_20250 [Clostridium sporogenes]
MIKYAIKSKDNNDVLIFHALPNGMAKFQWYISESIRLDLSIDNMISNGTIFDDISEFNEQGNIAKK